MMPKTNKYIICMLVVFLSSIMFSKLQARENIQSTNSKRYTGIVKDDTGNPIAGVSVIVSGTTVGTITADDGKFAIKVPSGQAHLRFSCIGYNTRNIKLGAKDKLYITLTTNSKLLGNAVVVGYGTLKKSDIASAITTVKPDEFNANGNGDALSLLEGKVAGLQVSQINGDDPTGSSSIQLRGVVSMMGYQAPLIVIDGIPGGSLDMVQPDDIESFNILKDGSAAAIYGSRANAGVILITTKSGKKGKAHIQYSTYYMHLGVRKRAPFMNGDQYRAAMHLPDNIHASNMHDYGSSTDWFDAMLNKSNFSQYHNLAISGGSDDISYRASVYYNDFNGIAKQNESERYGARATLNSNLYHNLITTQLSMITDHRKKNLLGGSHYNDDLGGGVNWENLYAMNPTMPIYKEDGSWWDEDAQRQNPLAKMDQEKNMYYSTNTTLSGQIGIHPMKGLNLNAFGSVQGLSAKQDAYQSVDSYASKHSDNAPGHARKWSQTTTTYDFEPTIEYKNTFGDHDVSAVVGYSYEFSKFDNFSADNYGFMNDQFEENSLADGTDLADGKAGMASHKESNTLVSFFGRVNYAYKQRYVLQASIRHEGSSKFGANHKWGNFPSVSAAWNISQEDFMKPVNQVSSLKLRVGYGVTGNSGIDNYMSLVKLGSGGKYMNYDGSWPQTYGPATNPNPDLKWETKKEIDVGVDFGLFKNKFSGTIDYYYRRTDDLLGKYMAPMPPYVSPEMIANVGAISSAGLEVTLSYFAITNKDFTWKTVLTGSYNKNKVISFSNSLFSLDYQEYGDFGPTGDMGRPMRTYPGDPIGNFYGLKFAGFDDKGDWLFYKKDGSKAHASQMSDEDKGTIGNAMPKVYASWNNYFTYKDFDLQISFAGKFGFDVLNENKLLYGTPVRTTNVLRDTFTGDLKGVSSMVYSDYFLSKGDYVKLDNITIGYTFKKKNGSKIPPFRLYVTGRNLFYITAYKGVSPEVNDIGMGNNNLGIDASGRYPSTFSIVGGLNITF